MPPHICYGGVVYIGHMVIQEDGTEKEEHYPVLCRHCWPSGQRETFTRTPEQTETFVERVERLGL